MRAVPVVFSQLPTGYSPHHAPHKTGSYDAWIWKRWLAGSSDDRGQQQST
ncbi:hypothetical protein DSM43276_02235 [Mycobacteroides salmoniphilum]|nr:hypothetical protein DSM43276_02235 [Mycobacteroides salmoniphilum]